MVVPAFFFLVETVAPLALAGFDDNLLDDTRRPVSIGCTLEDGLEKVLTDFFILVEIVARLAVADFGSSGANVF